MIRVSRACSRRGLYEFCRVMKVVRRVVTDTLLGNSFAPEDLGLSDLQIAKIFVHGEMDGVLEPEF